MDPVLKSQTLAHLAASLLAAPQPASSDDTRAARNPLYADESEIARAVLLAEKIFEASHGLVSTGADAHRASLAALTQPAPRTGVS